MSSFGRKNTAIKPYHLNCKSVSFSLFTREEIERICIKKICTPLTFDAMGYPLPGGLYDKVFGPISEKSDPCETCGQTFANCSGHYGYIELPLPIVNPLFHKIIATIMKITCLNCLQIQISGNLKYVFITQMKLLNVGLVTEANEIESQVQGLIAKYESLENVPEDVFVSIDKYNKLVEQNQTENNCNNKNVETIRNQFIINFLKNLKGSQSCKYCKKALNRIQTFRNRIFIHSSKKESVRGVKESTSQQLDPKESRRFMRELWNNEKELILQLVPVLGKIESEYPVDLFYFELLPVPPPNVRPVNFLMGQITENPQSVVYKSILQNCMLLRAVIQVVKNDGDVDVLPLEAKEAYLYAQGDTPIAKLNNVWESLQTNIDGLLDKELAPQRSGQGLKQIIEKKAGIIRMHMMGKRVDFAARSVITPDPNLNIGEIGIPEEFAKNLTYPVPVTPWNVEELRKMILNGPKVHPGAVMIELEDGTLTRINPNNLTHQTSLLKSLLTPSERFNAFEGVKRVHRHLCNGDILLLNRQPTLHKPSIMAHTARILKGEKTLRLHYANCKAYNADFDGDEMNAHFPQSELARSEGYMIANVSNQYLVPKDGTPLSGLIQDHVISGVKLSLRGRFFTKMDYQQLVFQALSHKTSNIKILPPAIIKPVCLWSGKQVLSTVIINIIPSGKEPVNLTSTSKISSKAWETEVARTWQAGGSAFKNPNTMSEAEVVIRKGELLTGVLDKTHYGATPYGLVHCIYELYGGACATRLLSSLGKLFMYFLQTEGFTLGVRDILVQEKANKKRRKIIKNARQAGKQAMTAALGLPEDTSEEEIVNVLQQNMAENPKLRATIDKSYKSVLDSYTNDINRTCLPAGLLCKFPSNNLQLMVQSGAKGSTVNTMQISCLLGQIELEGKRPPVMISGKSLPSFPVFEFAPRAGGFIEGRFMTGIQPQEFFFHCMAGREGLIDTAVKTSRSGYLQRCLVKHLEGLSVNYDLTVRDSDKTIIQFAYGEDGMDISKVQFLNKKQLNFLTENCDAILNKTTIKELRDIVNYKNVKEHVKEIKSWKQNHGSVFKSSKCSTPFTEFSKIIKNKLVIQKPNKISSKTGRSKMTKNIIEIWNEVDDDIRKKFYNECKPCPDPVGSIYQPDCYFGSLNERLCDLMDGHEELLKGKKDKKKFCDMFKLKAMQSLCVPGEPVGLLAAQSIGEPSTQMTLNTFHFAGRGEMNVTLGIPRLREILMLASKNIKTPSMEIPFLDVPNLEVEAEKLRKRLNRVVVTDVLEKIDVSVKLEINHPRQHTYKLYFHFLPHYIYKEKYHVKAKRVLKHMSEKYFDQMFAAIKRQAKTNSNLLVSEQEKKLSKKNKNDEDEDGDDEKDPMSTSRNEEDSSDEEPEDLEDAKASGKYEQVHDDQEPNELEENEELSDDEDNRIKNKNNEDSQKDDITKEHVVKSYNFVTNYNYDKKNYSWCELTFALPLTFKKIDLSTLLKQVASNSVIRQVPNIKRAITYMNNDKLYLRTDGVNIMEMFKYHDLLDLNKVYSNDVHKIAEMYGIEAAVKVIVREVRDVFNVYGITVDPRHLLLIADYMTTSGSYEPLSRKGMENSASPLQQISFESSLTFLKNATIGGKMDHLQNPSSCLMVGKPCQTGTGSFSLLQKVA